MKKAILWFLTSMVILSSCSEETKSTRVFSDTQETSTTISSVCGDGKISPNEEVCEGNFFVVSQLCSDYGYSDGLVKCTSCLLDFSDCTREFDNKPVEDPVDDPICGNGVKEGNEECDSGIFLGSCDIFGDYNKGSAYCIQCKVDLSLCSKETNQSEIPKDEPVCGNGIIEEGEECDTVIQDDELLCSFYGDYNKGNISCSSCKIDLSSCSKETVPVENPEPVCGNGIKEDGEDCDDGNNVNTDLCTNLCTLPKCNDGILSQGEICDGDLFTIQSCSEYNSNFSSGYLKCSSSCTIDYSSCIVTPKCGDGKVNSSTEECDGSVGSHTCKDIYSNATGNVICTSCKLDYSNCKEVCPTNREFKDGVYSTSSLTFHKVTEKGKTYIILSGQIGLVIDSSTVQWVYSSLGDEGYYSYFKVGSCDCDSCNVYFNNSSHLNKSDVKSVPAISYMYSSSTITEVPTYSVPSITIPDPIRTGDTSYLSCNDKECSDASDYYLNITSSHITVSTQTFNWTFSLIQVLGDDTYLVHYDSGYGLPNDLQKEGVTNPYAVIRITKSDLYRVCDIDTAQNIIVHVLSWSNYRDVAIAKADFSSTTSFTYLPALKDKENSCVWSEGTFDLLLTSSNPKGLNNYKIKVGMKYNSTYTELEDYAWLRTYLNYCYDRSVNGAVFRTTEKNEDMDGHAYRSLYRNNVLVFDRLEKNILRIYSTYPKNTAWDDSPQSLDEDIRYELEFPTEARLNLFASSQGRSYTMEVLMSVDKYKLCKINTTKHTKECEEVQLAYSLENNIPESMKPKTCEKKYQ